jgi:hypothetical protein
VDDNAFLTAAGSGGASLQPALDALQHQHHAQRDRDVGRIGARGGFAEFGVDVAPR